MLSSGEAVTDVPLPAPPSLLPCHLWFVWVPLAEAAGMGHGDTAEGPLAPALSAKQELFGLIKS